MRSDATTQDTVQALDPHAPQWFRLKVEIDRDGSGSGYVDVSNLMGQDYVRTFSRNRHIDRPSVGAQLSLAAWMLDPVQGSISPGMASSPNNAGGLLCKPYNRVKVSVSSEPVGVAHTSYHLLFDGRIQGWSQKEGSLTLNCRDLICDLQDTTIEREASYGAEDPTTATANGMEEVIQNILDDHINTTPSALRTQTLPNRTTDGAPWQLYSADGDSVTPFNAANATSTSIRLEQMAKRTIWEAISMYPQGIAYRLSRRWHNGSGINGFVLVLEEPDRIAATPVITLDPTLGQCRVDTGGLDREHVRNRVAIGYQLQGGRRDRYFNNDVTSENTYGKLYIGADPGSSSQIDTLAEATKMGDGMLSDVKDPLADVRVHTKLMWFLELNDLVRLKADNVHYDADQDLAAIGLSDTIAQNGPAMTTIQLRGKPAAGVATNSRKQRGYPQRTKSVDIAGFGSSLHPNPLFSDDGGV